MIEEKKVTRPKMQNLILENREKLNLTGVLDVISFNEESIIAETELGILIIRGDDLHISKLNIDSFELSIHGEITSLEYDDKERGKRGDSGLFSKIFR